MPRARAKLASLDEMLQVLKASYQQSLAPPLGGYAYRFTIFLPLLSEGQEVFSIAQRGLLGDAFHECFGGFTQAAAEGYPPFFGSWLPAGATRPIVDRHTLMVVYSRQTEEAKDFFRQLRWILEQKQVANQDIVLIEHTTVWLVESSPLRDAPR